MAQFASDTFEGTEGAELSVHSSNWTKVTGLTGNLEIASGRLRPSSTTTAAYYHSGSPASANYTVSAQVYKAAVTADILVGVIGRASTGANTHYRASINPKGSASVSQSQIFKFVSGTATQLGGNVDVAHSNGATATLLLRMDGSTIELDFGGSNIISATDSAITAAGKAGVRSFAGSAPTDANGCQLADFSADDIGGGYTHPTLSAATLISAGGNDYQPRVTYTF